MKKLDETELLKILEEPKMEERLQEELLRALEQIKNQNSHMEQLQAEAILSSSMGGCEIRETPGSPQSMDDGLYKVLERSQKLQREYMLGLKEKVCSLTEQIERVQRVWIVFDTLEAEARFILYGLYVENYKWRYMQEIMQMSPKTFVRKRREALAALIAIFNNETFTLRQLGRMVNRDTYKAPKKRKENRDGQMDLSQFFHTQ